MLISSLLVYAAAVGAFDQEEAKWEHKLLL